MNSEKPKVTLNLPVSFNINYNKDGTINIDIDTDKLECTIAEAIISALSDYNDSVKCDESKLTIL